MKPSRPSRIVARAFSLIEVTIAMAIAAVALSTLMALLPQGMNTMRDAGDEAIMARIHQQILNELQMANFEALNQYQGMEIYFDAQGEELGDSRSGGGAVKGSFGHIYTARVSVPGPTGGKMPDSVGGGVFSGYQFGADAPKTNLLRPVVIEVAAVSGLGASFDWGDQYRHMIHTYQTMVVKMGQTFQP
jgi:uncharacterized protein (TIGR02598 family)